MQKQKEYINFLVSRKSSVVKTSLIFALIGIIYSLFLNDHFRSTSVIVPTRDNYQSDNTSQIGAIAQTIGFGADDATPELKFALSYFNSYKFISEFIAEQDILPEILFFKSYNKRRNAFNFKVNPEDYRMDVLFPDGEVDYSSKHFQEAVKEFREIVTLNPGRENDPAMYLSVIHQKSFFFIHAKQRSFNISLISLLLILISETLILNLLTLDQLCQIMMKLKSGESFLRSLKGS